MSSPPPVSAPRPLPETPMISDGAWTVAFVACLFVGLWVPMFGVPLLGWPKAMLVPFGPHLTAVIGTVAAGCVAWVGSLRGPTKAAARLRGVALVVMVPIVATTMLCLMGSWLSQPSRVGEWPTDAGTVRVDWMMSFDGGGRVDVYWCRWGWCVGDSDRFRSSYGVEDVDVAPDGGVRVFPTSVEDPLQFRCRGLLCPSS